MVALGNFFFRWRTALSPLLLLLLFLPGRPLLDDPFLAALLGLAVAGCGQAIRAATIGLEYIVRGGRNHRVYAEELVTGGLFRHTRNPLYVGKFFMVLGAGVAANRWPALLAITVAYSFMYEAVVLAEEAYLRGKFGAAYDEYCARVPRWVPGLRGLRATLRLSRFNWRRVLLKEYSAPLGWTLPIVGMGLYNMSALGPLAQRSSHVFFLLAVLTAAGLLWAIAGALKRTRSPALRIADP